MDSLRENQINIKITTKIGKRETYGRKENIKQHNPNWPQLSDHPCSILIIGSSGSGRENALLSLISHELCTDKIYLYAKDPHKLKH